MFIVFILLSKVKEGQKEKRWTETINKSFFFNVCIFATKHSLWLLKVVQQSCFHLYFSIMFRLSILQRVLHVHPTSLYIWF